MYLIFDTETTGLPRDYNAPITDTSNWPRAVQIAWQLHDEWGKVIEHNDYLIKPVGFNIPPNAESVHGISTELALQGGEDLDFVLERFKEVIAKAKFIVGHNVSFDLKIMGCEFVRNGQDTPLTLPVLDTCTENTASLLKLPGGRGGKFKLPTLSELHQYLFDISFGEAHNATADVEATTRCFLELIRTGGFDSEELKQDHTYLEKYREFNPAPFQAIGLNHLNLKEESQKLREFAQKPSENRTKITNEKLAELLQLPFAHLHTHTQFSILQSTANIKSLVKKATELNMDGVAITDTGNMMAAFHFEQAISKYNKEIDEKKKQAEAENQAFEGKKIIPIIGCEFNVCRNRLDKTQKDNGYQIVILAKNKNGYQNLIKLASMAYTEGMYYVPRIDKNALEEYKSDLIVLSGNLNGEVPNLLLNVGETQAEEALLWWKAQFGEDFYLELNRHGLQTEDVVNQGLITLGQKHNVKVVATNNVYYLNKKDAEAHDVLLCVKENELITTPKGRGRGFRFGLENDEFYFKTHEEMVELFSDIPEALYSIAEIIEKVEPYPLKRDVLLPAFDIPEQFRDEQDAVDGGKRGENNYLRHLTYVGAEKRYEILSDEIRERIDFELKTIEKTGYPGYFLIVQDFCQAARDMGVSVGPGRGSAAGSAVAYCIGITNVDPIKYDLLFERFLNPDRISMPDIDIDFDDEGRGRVIQYVIDKYGASQVSQIITYGTMAAKSAIRDTARVMDLPLPDADRLAKLIPNEFNLGQIMFWEESKLRENAKNQDSMQMVLELRDYAKGNDLSAQVLRKAAEIEGSVRNTGIHACGVIITPDDLTNFVPVATAKDSDMVCTQFDNSVAESAGLLKMDFLGLKTLTLIKDAVKNVKERHGIDLDPDAFPIDDVKTYELFQRGETVGIFQYESTGMQKYLKELKPTVFADLIAMNALYRPGPLEYIPLFIKRKHGEVPIVYDLDDCEEYLKETYGITVYQEQVMLLSQKLAGFTKGEADTLRKAMGKKQRDVLDKMKPTFIERGQEKGHDPTILEKVWTDWEAFASYAFNKSHSTCYAWVAYQTAYLKANYPAEYMASVLSNNMNDIKSVSIFMEECQRMGIAVLGPDVNESKYRFTVNKEGAVRFGLGAIKGVGESPVNAILEERTNGNFTSVFDFVKRANAKVVNKRVMESLIYAGAMDSFKEIHRAQYFALDKNNRTFIETLQRYGAAMQEAENSAQESLFGGSSAVSMPEPVPPAAEPWTNIFQLGKEKEVIGIFISGHPLDDYKLEMNAFCTGNLRMLLNMDENRGRQFMFAAVISKVEHKIDKNGNGFANLYLEDYTDSFRMSVFNEQYMKFKHFFHDGAFLTFKGKIEIPLRRTEPQFNISSIDLLSNLREKMAKSLQININPADLNQVLIQSFYEMIEEFQGGNLSLEFVIHDPTTGIEIRMPSKTTRIRPENELFRELERMKFTFHLN
ncbi:MAG: hypothetical protein RL264_211 [Bacteroidota bacterium]|jgi:DNA polymerase-3 subunit alpha